VNKRVSPPDGNAYNSERRLVRAEFGSPPLIYKTRITMGLENRDYARSSGRGGGFGESADVSHSQGYWAIKYIIIANIVVFVLQAATQDSGFIQNALSLSLDDLKQFQVWRLLTYGFCHGNLQHILWNMVALFFLGRYVEPLYGSKEFLAFYLTGIVISGICHVGLEVVQGGHSSVIGASGGVNAVVFLCAMIYPTLTMLFMFVIPVQLRFLAVGYALIDLFGVINPRGSVVAHAAHLGGAAFGVAYKYYGWRILPLFQFRNWKLPKRGPKPNANVRIHRPPEENIDSRVDEILVKIQNEGEGSLTDEERRILTEASKRYKNRT